MEEDRVLRSKNSGNCLVQGKGHMLKDHMPPVIRCLAASNVQSMRKRVLLNDPKCIACNHLDLFLIREILDLCY